MASDDQNDSTNLKATYSVLLFGVPSHGMNIESLIPMVGDQPNRQLLESLDRVSEVLQAQNIDFPRVFKFEDSELITFFETRQSPTAKKVNCRHSIPQNLTFLSIRNSSSSSNFRLPLS